MPESLLQATAVHKHFGGVAALRGASLQVLPGEVHALMGENGAGKSTLARAIAGIVRVDTGSVHIDGVPVSIAGPSDAQRFGIGIIHQELDLFPNLTVGENMVIGNLCFREGQWSRPKRMEAFCRPFLDQVGLTVSIGQSAALLSIAQRQLLAIARALSMNARLLLMDEPTSSLFDDNVERLFGLIRDLRARGVSVIYVSHKMDEIFRISDRVTVMRDGETVGTRETQTTNSGELIRMMVGRDLDSTSSTPRQISNEAILEFDNVSTKRLRSVAFALHRGEVLGIAGLVGAGRSGVGAALFGIDRTVSGTMRLNGTLFAPRSPREAMRHGVGLVPEDRRVEGLMMSMTVLENASFAVPGSRQTRTQFAQVARQLALQCPSEDTCVSHLSGGNQQKVLLARWLLLQPGVLFLDDPTRGIDVAAKHDIYRLIAQLSEAGRAVILVSSELPELLRCCHRILVLREGRVAAIFDASEATQEKIMAAATLAEAHA